MLRLIVLVVGFVLFAAPARAQVSITASDFERNNFVDADSLYGPAAQRQAAQSGQAVTLPPAQNQPAAEPAAMQQARFVVATPAARPTPGAPLTPGAQLLATLVPRKGLTAGECGLRDTRDDSFEDPINWSVTIFKSRHQLLLYYKGRLFHTYHAVFGRSPEAGTKLWQGDLRTPEGVYTIIQKHDSTRWKRFLSINYPNSVDIQRYGQLHEAGEVPPDEDDHRQPRPVGGEIGIHGTDEPRFNQWNINWTAGCISVDNGDIMELDRLLPVGTLVIIKP